MLRKIMNIRAVLEVAAECERDGMSGLKGASEALQELKDIHTALMGIEDQDKDAKSLEDWQVGGGNYHG